MRRQSFFAQPSALSDASEFLYYVIVRLNVDIYVLSLLSLNEFGSFPFAADTELKCLHHEPVDLKITQIELWIKAN